MTTISERVRNAIAATAAQVAAETIPPLDLAPAMRRPAGVPRLAGLRHARILVPFAAAVTLGLAMTASAAISGALHHAAGPGRSGAAGGPGAAGHPAGPAGHAGTAGAPKFYVTLTQRSTRRFRRPLAVTVRATATGRALARIDPTNPHYTFSGVLAAADDRTFVLAENSGWLPIYKNGAKPPKLAVRFYLMTFNPATDATRLTRLPVNLPSEQQIQGMALSPDGTRLAVATGGNLLRVYLLRTGAVRTWQATGPAVQDGWLTELSWTADDRYLGFDAFNWPTARWGLNVLDTAKAGHNLLADSRIVLPDVYGGNGPGCDGYALLADDGATIACPYATGMSDGLPRRDAGYAIFSARTGKLLRRLDTGDRRGRPIMLWISPSGYSFIAQPYFPNSPVLLISQRAASTVVWPHANYSEQDSIADAGWAW